MITPKYDLAVIGGGSGGFGAALAAARMGANVLLVESGPMLGGNSTLGGVNTWEPGVSGPGFSFELFEHLQKKPFAIALSRSTKFWEAERPWGVSQPQKGLKYRQSLGRSGISNLEQVRVTFEPDLLAAEMLLMLEEAGAEVRLGTRFVAAQTEGRRVTRIRLDSGEEIAAKFVVDATAQILVTQSLGCQTAIGAESKATYDEPSAPNEAIFRLNGVSVCFRVTRAEKPEVEALPPGVSEEFYPVVVSMMEYPNGDLNMNPLPIMEGAEFAQMEPKAARAECEKRVFRCWNWLQSVHGFDRYRLKHLFPFTGVREGPRLVGRRVLTENDVRAGWEKQIDAARCIALADHSLDTHGEGTMCREVEQPYGVPYECLLPQEFDNLAVACRGASFSHLAASSCRLSRTMTDLGHAAGLGLVWALQNDALLPDVDVSWLRKTLDAQNVALNGNDKRLAHAL